MIYVEINFYIGMIYDYLLFIGIAQNNSLILYKLMLNT